MKTIRLWLAGIAVMIAGGLAAQPKYIFYFVGDGMGAHQVMATQIYLASLQSHHGVVPLCFTQFPYSGQLSTYSASHDVTDSSAAGTALASGQKTGNHRLGVDTADRSITSMAEILHRQGWAIGVTSTVSVDNATPAAHYAHVPSRSDYYTVGQQLAASGFEFFGGSSFLLPQGKNGDRPNLYTLCEQNGYTFAHGMAEFRNIESQKPKADKVILIQPNEGQDISRKSAGLLPFAINRKHGVCAPGDTMKLSDLIVAGIEHLSRYDRFMLFAEAGSIDWACHGQDGATAIHEVLDLDEAVAVALRFYRAHPDETLIIVTADHETGGLTLGGNGSKFNMALLAQQHVSVGTLTSHLQSKVESQKSKVGSWEAVREVLRRDLGFFDTVTLTGEEEQRLHRAYKQSVNQHKNSVKTLYEDLNILAYEAIAILNKKANLTWVTKGHTASPVPIYAIGQGAEMFSGWQDNTDVARKISSNIKK